MEKSLEDTRDQLEEARLELAREKNETHGAFVKVVLDGALAYVDLELTRFDSAEDLQEGPPERAFPVHRSMPLTLWST